MERKVFSLLTFLFLFATSVLAQDLLSQLTSILTQFVGVIFILIFVLILLAIGGVLPKPSGRIPIGLILFLALIILLFIIPQFIPYPQYLEVPESFRYQSLPEPAKDALQFIGLPRDWGYVPAIIYLFILPFAAIYTLVWAFLTSLKIFEGMPRVNRILALIIAFMTIPLGWFVKIVWILFSFMGAWSIVIFAATFIIGIFFRGYGISAGEYYKTMARRWREEAKNYLQKALIDIKEHRSKSAQENLERARSITGFSTKYYDKINEAINTLAQGEIKEEGWNAAESAVRDAQKEIS